MTEPVVPARDGGDGAAGRGAADGDLPPLAAAIDLARLPRHVAIIMDGNGRWAQERGLPRMAGHRAGVSALKKVVRTAAQLGVEVLTVYAFSTENWERPPQEVAFLMELLVTALRNELDSLARNSVRLRFAGDAAGLPGSIQTEIERAVHSTAHNQGLQLTIALNYGGRREIVRAAAELARAVLAGDLTPEQIDEEVFSHYLYTDGLPDPDLCIRTGGEWRISNFLLWQLAYAELWVTPVYWPEFDSSHFCRAILDYQGRQRRFGRVV